MTRAAAYSIYGEALYAAGSAQTAYGFTNEYTDAAGLTYLRARHYSAAMGRFMTRDTWEGDVNQPMSYNAWLYGYADPVRFTDPTGQWPLATFENGNNNPPNLSGFTHEEKMIIERALYDVALAYGRAYYDYISRNNEVTKCLPPEIRNRVLTSRMDPVSVFKRIHGGTITFVMWAYDNQGKPFKDYPGDTNGKNRTNVYWHRRGNIYVDDKTTFVWRSDESYRNFIVHEAGHAFNNALHSGQRLMDCTVQPGARNDRYPVIEVCRHPELLTSDVTKKNGFYENQKGGWQRRSAGLTGYVLANEIFADQFIGWVYDKWELNDKGKLTEFGQKRRDFMDLYMPYWIWSKLTGQ